MEMRNITYYYQPLYACKPINSVTFKILSLRRQKWQTKPWYYTMIWYEKLVSLPLLTCRSIRHSHRSPTSDRCTYWISFCTTDREETWGWRTKPTWRLGLQPSDPGSLSYLEDPEERGETSEWSHSAAAQRAPAQRLLVIVKQHVVAKAATVDRKWSPKTQPKRSIYAVTFKRTCHSRLRIIRLRSVAKHFE